jgi:hypothetical protein
MNLTVRDLLANPGLGLRLVTGSPHSLSRVVSWAHSTEMIDPRPHVRSEELICTLGASLVTRDDCVRFVEAVHASDSSGICLGLGEVHTQAPPGLRKSCEQRGVVLIEMAHDVPFMAINHVLTDARLASQATNSARDGALLAELIEAVREGHGVPELVAIASDALGGRVEFLSGSDSVAAGQLRADAEPETVTVPLGPAESIGWTRPRDTADSPVLGQVGRIVQIAQRERDASEAEQRTRVGQLMTLVIEGLAGATILHPDLGRRGLLDETLVVSAWPNATGGILARLMTDSLVGDASEATIAISPGRDSARDAAESSGRVCGYSSPVRLDELGRGIVEARAALALARRRGEVAGPEMLTTLASLLEQQPAMRLVPFADQLIRPLLATSVRGGADLVDTLRAYVAHGGAIAATAQEQYLHVNSVRHRLARVAQIVGRDPLDPDDRTAFEIALWISDRLPARAD